MQALRPYLLITSVVALLGVVGYLTLRADSAPVPEPVSLMLLGSGLFACAQARRQLLKKV